MKLNLIPTLTRLTKTCETPRKELMEKLDENFKEDSNINIVLHVSPKLIKLSKPPSDDF